MSRLKKWMWKRRGYLSGRPEPVWKKLIEKYAPNRTFVDVGCMWRVNGEYSFHAASVGASAVTGVDIQDATQQFHRKNAERGNAVRFIRGNLNDPAIDSWASPHDVVFCSGVLYHVPNPIFSIFQLRRLCKQTLILTSASIMERGTPHSAVFLPGLSGAMRKKLNYQVRANEKGKIGLDAPIESDRGYAPWFWLPTASCIAAMVEAVGFEVVELFKHRRVTTVVASVARDPILPPL